VIEARIPDGENFKEGGRERFMSNIFNAEFAGRNISLKANYMAGQADGAILVTYGDTVVIVPVVSSKNKREGWIFCL